MGMFKKEQEEEIQVLSNKKIIELLRQSGPFRHKFIRLVMELRGLNTSQLVAKAGVSFNTVGNLLKEENNKRNPIRSTTDAIEPNLWLPCSFLYDFNKNMQKGVFGIFGLETGYWNDEEFKKETDEWYKSIYVADIKEHQSLNEEEEETEENDTEKEEDNENKKETTTPVIPEIKTEIQRFNEKIQNTLVSEILDEKNVISNKKLQNSLIYKTLSRQTTEDEENIISEAAIINEPINEEVIKRFLSQKDDNNNYEKIICLGIARKRNILPECYESLYKEFDIRKFLISFFESTERTTLIDRDDIKKLFDLFELNNWKNNIDDLIKDKNTYNYKMFLSYFHDMVNVAKYSGLCEKSTVVKEKVEWIRRMDCVDKDIDFSKYCEIIIDLWDAIKSSYFTVEFLKSLIMLIDYKDITFSIKSEKLYEIVDTIGQYYQKI